VMATRNGIVKKTALSEYSRPRTGGLIAIKLKEGDELVDVVIVGPGDDVLLATATGMAIRFPHTKARAMGRAAAGVRGVKLTKGDELVGIVVAKPDMQLLSACEHGYGKRTPFGLGGSVPETDDVSDSDVDDASADAVEAEADEGDSEEGSERSNFSYRSQNRGGKGLRDIRTTARNGRVVDILAVEDGDEVLMVTTGGKIQRLRVTDISVVGRNTQGVRIIRLDDDDALASMARIPGEIIEDEPEVPAAAEASAEQPADASQDSEPVDDAAGESEESQETD